MKRALAERAKQTLPKDAKLPRLQEPASSPVSRSVPDDASAFYLKHQNRALVTELHSLQHTVQQLEAERHDRRHQCRAAAQALESLQATWTQLELALEVPTGGVATATVGDAAASTVGDAAAAGTKEDETATQTLTDIDLHNTNATPSTMPRDDPSSVEWTIALQRSLAQLARVSSSTDDCAVLSHHLAQRAQVLQEALLQVKEPIAVEALSTASTNANNENNTQLAELAHSRQQALHQERQLRRNLYRLSVGMLTLDQVLQTVEGGDDDDAEWVQQQRSVLAAAPTATTATSNATGNDDDSPASSEQMQALHAQLQDAQRQVASRDESIQEVGGSIVRSWMVSTTWKD